MPYVSQCVVMIEGPLDGGTLKESLLKIVEQHEILRTNFTHWAEMNISVQTISAARIAWAEDCDLSGRSAQEQELELQRLIECNRQAPFDLERGAVLHAQLVRTSFSEHQLILNLPALCADNHTLGSLVQQLGDCYRYGLEGKQPNAERPLQYADVSQWYYDALEAEDAQVGREYWRNQKLAGVDSIALPFEKCATNETLFQPQVCVMKISDELNRKLKTREFSLPAFFLSCWQILLWRLTRHSPLQIGLACNGRNYPELEQVSGPLTKHVPLVSTIDAGDSSGEIIQRAAATMDEAWQWQDCFTWTGRSNDDSSPSFLPVCFEFIEQPADVSADGARFSIRRQYSCFDRFKLKLTCIQAGHSLLTELHYDSALFEAESIQCLSSRFHTLIASVLAKPDGVAASWEILSENESETLSAFNATAREFPEFRCYQQLFEEQVARTPDTPALCCDREQLSYAELNAAANSLAHHLIRHGIGPEHRVALCLDRSLLMMIALLGTLKAGAAYLPLDVQVPARRLQLILEDAQVSAVITREQFRGLLPPEPAFPIWCLDTDSSVFQRKTQENPLATTQSENLVYVIYTSGSTGTPKGVMIDHRGLFNYLNWAKEVYRIGEGSRTLVHSPFSFDLTITGLLLPLIAGGTVELVSQGDELERLCEALASPEQHYSLIKLTPSHLRVLSGWLGERQRCGSVDALIIGGEALPAELLSVWQQQSQHTRLINEYGPTETVVGCCIYEVPASSRARSIPIGRPIGNMQLYVLDEAMRLAPPGMTGEIYIGGAGVARGYLNQAALTAERFVPDPFSVEPGKRLYRSGDLGRMQAGGEMEYLGRTDDQVKIRGFRIELGEIEAVLGHHPMVKDSTVVLQESGEEKRLLGYVVLREQNGNGRELKRTANEEIQTYLKRELPEYMLPKDIIVLDRMQLTPNGKVDRKALPLRATEVGDEDEEYLEQLSPAGKILTQLWCELLNLERIEVNDNFFTLGGDSILAVQIALKAKRLGLTFHPVQLFRYPTIAELETALTKPAAESPAGLF
jgi:amino acid adenylation domain-containing protein